MIAAQRFRHMENGNSSGLIALATFTLLLAAPVLPAFSQQHSLSMFEGNADVGTVKRPGSATYDAEKQEYVVAGAGYNMWFDHDEFHVLWKRLRGDFILRTSAHFLGDGVDAHRKTGWIVRSSLDSGATHINAAVHGDGLTALQFRRTPGGDTEEVRSFLTGADVIQLARKGNTYTMSVARYGEPFVTEQVEDLDLGDEVYVGLFVCSHNEDVLEQAVFRNVRIVVPAPDDFVPYRDYIGSNLEILDVESGHRKILYRSTESLQAPNWTPDGKALIYNSNGLLYRFDLHRKTPEVIHTGFATRNNNDHVLSFDGKMLGISHHSEDHDGQSIVYTVPVEGGMPALMTSTGPSYLHGWSPDDRFLTYTGGRNGNYDIYKIPVEGGDEIRLTTVEALDDHPFYKQVYLRLMPIEGGEPRVIAYLYGGQGTINVPSWSPDSKRVAFVGNTDMKE